VKPFLVLPVNLDIEALLPDESASVRQKALILISWLTQQYLRRKQEWRKSWLRIHSDAGGRLFGKTGVWTRVKEAVIKKKAIENDG
jgi:hypothetical protein